MEPKRSALARPDRTVLQARKESAQRIEELKLKLAVLTEKYFEQSLRIVKNWIRDAEKNSAPKR